MWGNPKLVTWDYNKDVNLTLEDALISMESLRFMLGGKLKQASNAEGGKVKVRLTEEVVIETENELPSVKNHLTDEPYGTQPTTTGYKYINLTTGERGEVTLGNSGSDPVVPAKTLKAAAGDHLRIFWEQEVDGTNKASAVEIVISPDTFPGTLAA